jgi:hypothetical protein
MVGHSESGNLDEQRRSICRRLSEDWKLLIEISAACNTDTGPDYVSYLETLEHRCGSLVSVLPTYEDLIPSDDWLHTHCGTNIRNAESGFTRSEIMVSTANGAATSTTCLPVEIGFDTLPDDKVVTAFDHMDVGQVLYLLSVARLVKRARPICARHRWRYPGRSLMSGSCEITRSHDCGSNLA